MSLRNSKSKYQHQPQLMKKAIIKHNKKSMQELPALPNPAKNYHVAKIMLAATLESLIDPHFYLLLVQTKVSMGPFR